jgi:hypothetical protein
LSSPKSDDPKTEVAASLMIYGADLWTPEGRKRIADWLRNNANDLEEHGADYAKTFRARYHIPRGSQAKAREAAKASGGGGSAARRDKRRNAGSETVMDT